MTTAIEPAAAKLLKQTELEFLSVLHNPWNGHLQEACFDSPFYRPINHKGRAIAEHNSDGIGKCESPSFCPSTQTLGRDFGSIGIADG